jgi:hypothetical protein
MNANITSKQNEPFQILDHCDTASWITSWKRLSQLAKKVVFQAVKHQKNGFTLNPSLGTCLALGPNTNTKIFVVSVAGHELRLDHIPTEVEVLNWLVECEEILSRDRMFIGFWTFEGKFYLDISVLIRGKNAALNFARANDQQAIFHPASGESIPVSTTERIYIHDKPLEPVFGN